MPKGIPNIISNYDRNRDLRKELAQGMPQPEVLGEIKVTSGPPESTVSEWTREDGTVITLTEPPPPWEVTGDDGMRPSDARRFVEVPPNWKLYWINPKLLNSEGWRDWQAVMATDSRVKVRVSTMVTPENYIRRGGPNGDILCWMWAGWYQSVVTRNQEKIAAQSEDAVENQMRLKEEFARGKFGPNMRVEQTTHPRYTNARIDNPTD